MDATSSHDAWLRGLAGVFAILLVGWLEEFAMFSVALSVGLVALVISLAEASVKSASRPLAVSLVVVAAATGVLATTVLGPDAHAWLLLLPASMAVTDRFGRALIFAAIIPIVATAIAMAVSDHSLQQIGIAVLVLGAVALAPWASASGRQREVHLQQVAHGHETRSVQLQRRAAHLQAELREGSSAIRRTRSDMEAAMERAEARHSSILRAMAEGVMTVDRDGRISTANPAAANLFGVELKELQGAELRQFIPEFRIDTILAELGSLSRFGEPLQLEARRSTLVWDAELVFGSLDPDDEFSDVTVIIRDVTERARIERMKDELIATVSHELRTPLTGVLGAIGLLTSRVRGDAKSTSLVELAQRNADRLNRLVEDILDVQRIEANRYDVRLETVSVAKVMAAVVTEAELRGAGRQVALEIQPVDETLPPVRADIERVGQAVAHLIANAEKFAPAGTSIVVRAVAEGGHVRIEVVDQGPGLTSTQVLRVFRKFEVVETGDTRVPGGAGVGLTIVGAVARAHGHELGVDSRKGEGATFYLCLACAD